MVSFSFLFFLVSFAILFSVTILPSFIYFYSRDDVIALIQNTQYFLVTDVTLFAANNQKAIVSQQIDATVAKTLYLNPPVSAAFMNELVMYKDTHEVVLGFRLGNFIGEIEKISLHVTVLWAEVESDNEPLTLVVRRTRNNCFIGMVIRIFIVNTDPDSIDWTQRSHSTLLGSFHVKTGSQVVVDLPNITVASSLHLFNSQGSSENSTTDICLILSVDSYRFLKLDIPLFYSIISTRPFVNVTYDRLKIVSPRLKSINDFDAPLFPVLPEINVCCPSVRFCEKSLHERIYTEFIDSLYCFESIDDYAVLTPKSYLLFHRLIPVEKYPLRATLILRFHDGISIWSDNSINIDILFSWNYFDFRESTKIGTVLKKTKLSSSIFRSEIDVTDEVLALFSILQNTSKSMENCPYVYPYPKSCVSLYVWIVASDFTQLFSNYNFAPALVLEDSDRKFEISYSNSQIILHSEVNELKTTNHTSHFEIESKSVIANFDNGQESSWTLTNLSWTVIQSRCPKGSVADQYYYGFNLTVEEFNLKHHVSVLNLTRSTNFNGCLPNNLGPIPSMVPGYIHLDLFREKIIDDPLLGDNNTLLGWISLSDWKFASIFQVDLFMYNEIRNKYFGFRQIQLVASGIDTVFILKLAGLQLFPKEKNEDLEYFSGNNMYQTWTFDVPLHLLKPDFCLPNTACFPIEIEILSPVEYSNKAADDYSTFQNYTIWHQKLNQHFHPDVNSSGNSFPFWKTNPNENWNFIRKAPYHFGWDWGPSVISAGIWQELSIRYISAISIDSVRFLTDFNYLENNILVSIDVFLVNFPLIKSNMNLYALDLKISVNVPSLFAKDIQLVNIPYADFLSLCNNTFSSKFGLFCSDGKKYVSINQFLSISSVKLWFPRSYGKASLYDLKIESSCSIYLLNDPSNIIFKFDDFASKMVGFRDVKIETIRGSFAIYVNRERIWIKGVNWIPPSVFYVPSDPAFVSSEFKSVYSAKTTPKSLIHYFESMSNANINLIRIWGGGVYETSFFYEFADKMGILVWQDFMFSCSLYPSDSIFLRMIKMEILFQVRRLHTHPSVVVWCGSNEIEWNLKLRDFGPLNGTSLNKYKILDRDYEVLFIETIGKVLQKENKNVFATFWHSSPSNGNGGIDIPISKWGYPNDPWRGTIHSWEVWFDQNKSFRYFETIHANFVAEFGFQSFPNLNTLIRNNLFLNSSEINLTDVLLVKNRQRSPGGMLKLVSRICDYFGLVRNTELLVYYSNIFQSLVLKTAINHFRFQKSCSGLIVWQINDVWVGPTWSMINYDGSWKASMFTLKNSFDDILIGAIIMYPLLNNDGYFTAKGKEVRYSSTSEKKEAELSFSVGAELQVWRANTLPVKQLLVMLAYFQKPQSIRIYHCKNISGENNPSILYSANLFSLLRYHNCTIFSCFLILQSHNSGFDFHLLSPSFQTVDKPVEIPKVSIELFNFSVNIDSLKIKLFVKADLFAPYSWFEFLGFTHYEFKISSNLLLLGPELTTSIEILISPNPCALRNLSSIDCRNDILSIMKNLRVTCVWGILPVEISSVF